MHADTSPGHVPGIHFSGFSSFQTTTYFYFSCLSSSFRALLLFLRCCALGDARAKATAPCSAISLMASSEVEILTVKEEEEDTDEADANAPCEDDCAAVQN